MRDKRTNQLTTRVIIHIQIFSPCKCAHTYACIRTLIDENNTMLTQLKAGCCSKLSAVKCKSLHVEIVAHIRSRICMCSQCVLIKTS